jgi:hypothetical protein
VNKTLTWEMVIVLLWSIFVFTVFLQNRWDVSERLFNWNRKYFRMGPVIFGIGFFARNPRQYRVLALILSFGAAVMSTVIMLTAL